VQESAFVHPQVGESIAEYRITRKLGEGGMGSVYQCFDETLSRHVALKLLRPEYSQNPKFRARFEIEAKAVAQLRHPNIIQVFRAGEDPQRKCLFFVMDFIEGRALEDCIQDKKQLSVEETLHYVEEAAQALVYSHHKNILHRDIKPANIMITPENHALLADFGLAKVIGNAEDSLGAESPTTAPLNLKLTQQGSIVGTPYYMAPERIDGVNDDPRSEVYALGMVLYHCLTGVPPFQKNTLNEILNAQKYEEVIPLTHYAPQCPPEVIALFHKATAKQRSERFQDMQQFLSRMEAIRQGKIHQKELEEKRQFSREMAVALSSSSMKESSSRFKRQFGGALGVLGILTLFGFAFSYFSASPPKPAPAVVISDSKGSREGDLVWVQDQETRLIGRYLEKEEAQEEGVYFLFNTYLFSEETEDQQIEKVYYSPTQRKLFNARHQNYLQEGELFLFTGKAILEEEGDYLEAHPNSVLPIFPLKVLLLEDHATTLVERFTSKLEDKYLQISGTIAYINEEKEDFVEVLLADREGRQVWIRVPPVAFKRAESQNFIPRIGEYCYGIGRFRLEEENGKELYVIEVNETEQDAFAAQK
jgi:serine/threonine protein kinase